MLSWSNFVMLGLSKNAKLPKLAIEVFHELGDLGFDDAKIMVIELLSFWSWSAEEGSAGEHEVLPLLIKVFIDEEVFLFWASGGLDVVDVFVVEVLKDTHGLLV